MFPNVAQVPIYNSHSPFDGPPDGLGGSGLGTLLHRTKGVIKFVYDFAVLGGAISTIPLVDDLGNIGALLPSTAVITRSWVNHITPCTSLGSATVALTFASAADVLAATAVASMTGTLEGIQDGTATHFIKLSAVHTLSAVIAVAALTAGKFNVYLEYVV